MVHGWPRSGCVMGSVMVTTPILGERPTVSAAIHRPLYLSTGAVPGLDSGRDRAGYRRGVTISPSDPFATPDHLRSPVRRLRGRLPAAVTLWTAPGPAGLAVSSTLVVDGEPGRLLGVLDEESDLWAGTAS